MTLYFREPAKRHQHDCDNCDYRGSTRTNANGDFADWYICTTKGTETPKWLDVSVILRFSSKGSDYVSSALHSRAVNFDFVKQALDLGILELAVSPKKELENW